MDKVFVRNPYNYDSDRVSTDTGLKCEDLSLAVQESRDEVDINTIVTRFGLTGKLPEDVRAPMYGDFTGLGDFRQALHAVMEAEASFALMPADVRKRFDNDPALFVDFCSDAGNRDEMRKLGLLVPEAPKVEPLQVRVIADPVA